jgi:hypothetical protein
LLVQPNIFFTWLACPIAILAWIHLLDQLHLPSLILLPLISPVLLVLIGGSLYVLRFWFDQLLEQLLDSRHPICPQRLCLIPDLYEGIWIAPSRRKRRGSGPGQRFCVHHGFRFPSISFTTREGLSIVMLLLGWLLLSELPSLNPSIVPPPSDEYK